jgi:hypothetical protein
VQMFELIRKDAGRWINNFNCILGKGSTIKWQFSKEQYTEIGLSSQKRSADKDSSCASLSSETGIQNTM